MTVRFLTSNNAALLAAFNSAILQTEPKGKIETWVHSNDGKYFTHTSKQWAHLAWFRPIYYKGQLNFAIIKPGNKNVTTTVYGFYHGHLIETFLNHFDQKFTTAAATAMPTGDDKLS